MQDDTDLIHAIILAGIVMAGILAGNALASALFHISGI
jgi:hypothetical protein